MGAFRDKAGVGSFNSNVSFPISAEISPAAREHRSTAIGVSAANAFQNARLLRALKRCQKLSGIHQEFQSYPRRARMQLMLKTLFQHLLSCLGRTF